MQLLFLHTIVGPYLIGIAGESGVGKSTITEIISMFFGAENVTSISTDDLHKWERANKAWHHITHLNPEANNLELGDMHLQDLAHGKAIYRSIYNHDIGGFNPPVKIIPNTVVIVEGLHAFYTDLSKQLISLKIFIDTDDSLRTHWKIIRDTEERGYKYNEVLDSINKRRADNDLIRQKQISTSNVVIKISPQTKIQCLGDKNEKIDLNVSMVFNTKTKHKALFDFIQSYIVGFNNFVDLSELVGNNIELCQNGGGNISVKVDDKFMIIKSSGFDLKDVYTLKGYSVIKHNPIQMASDEKSLSNLLTSSIALDKFKRPSMETGAHVLLPHKYVLHAHPIYTTLLLCLENSREIIAELFQELDYEYVEFAPPAFGLFNQIKSLKPTSIYFLENHGIIIGGDNINITYGQLVSINNKAKAYIQNKCNAPEFAADLSHDTTTNQYAFPDAAVFSNNESKQDTLAAHNYIKTIGPQLGTIRWLAQETLDYITGLEAEKHRSNL